MTVQSTGCVFAFFVTDTKIVFGYNFVALLIAKINLEVAPGSFSSILDKLLSFSMFNPLIARLPVLPSYRNLSIDLLCKSLDWFLHEGNTVNYWVNVKLFGLF